MMAMENEEEPRSSRRGHICQCLTHLSFARADQLTTLCQGRRKTGSQFVDTVLRIAGILTSPEVGLKRGEVVATAAYNSEYYMEWLMAIAFVGGIPAPLNYRWSFEEARTAMESTNPVILIVDENCETWSSRLVTDVLPSLRFHIFINPTTATVHDFQEGIRADISRSFHEGLITFKSSDFLWSPDSVALICFTSGTTGRPKGVALSHTALIIQSMAKISVVGYNNDDVYLHTAPLCHIGGLSSALAVLMAGGCHVLIPKFSGDLAFEAINLYSVTSFITVPTIMVDLLTFFKRNGKIAQTVKRILNGGGGLSPEQIKHVSQVFPNASLFSAYGMTEACSSITFINLIGLPGSQSSSRGIEQISDCKSDKHVGLSGVCVGKPATHIEIQINGLQHGDQTHLIKVGNILTRGLHVMDKYWSKNSLASSSPFNESGWLDTGDIGWMDVRGNLWLQGRSNNRIKSGGENVCPEEVERVLLQNPGISNCVVVGIPDVRLSEAVTACIQLKQDWKWIDDDSTNTDNHFLKFEMKDPYIISSNILRSYCEKTNLSRFKTPKIFIPWRKPFPLTSTGKVMRDAVRKEAILQSQKLHSKL